MRRVAIVLLGVLLLSGCIGSRQDIRFSSAQVPLSLSGQLLDARGEAVSGDELETVGRLGASRRGWSIFWTLLPLRRIDFSREVNAQVVAAGGEGVINLLITAEDGCTRSLNQVPFAALLPIFPGCTDVTISGEIVRQRQDTPKKEVLRLLR